MKKTVLTLVAIALLTLSSFAQVAINTTGAPANASAILDVSSTDKGLLIPRMTTNNRTNDVTPVAGLLVYDTDTDSFWYYDGTQSSWVEIKAGTALDINSLADGISDSTSVFLGSNAGSADDGTNYNTALGINTLAENTSGKHNVAIGNAALANNKWRSGLVAIGDSALYTSPGTSVYFYGTENTAIGASALLSNTIGSTNTAIGYNTMYSNTSGNNNTAVGKAALYSNTEGYYNTSIGYKSMYNNTDGESNTAVGNSTLRDNTTGNYNTAIGRSALISSTTASRNTAAGYRALYYDTTGSYNTATGFYSLYKNRNGDYNNASGYQSMYCNTTGSSNVAMGVNSLYYNTTRSNLVAIGDSALYNNGLGATGDTEATANTAVGSKALYSNTTGHNNVGIGSAALYCNDEGNENTAVGYQAGWGGYGIGHNASGCVYLGNKAGRSNTSSNKLFITNSEDATPLIGGDFSTEQVDINGTIKITGGSPGADKVLTSDADGLASWQTKTYGATELNGLSDAKTNATSIFIGDLVAPNDDGNNHNTVVGDEAFRANIAGQNNTAFGYKTLGASTNNDNSAFGAFALGENTSGHYNTATGQSAMYYNQTGNNNTAVGYFAGEGTSGNSISGCVFLGYQAGKSNTSSNKLFIDNSDDTTPLIGGDFSSDELYFNANKVGIGTDNPSELLEVAGTSGNTARMIVSDGEGSNRNALLFVSPSSSYSYGRIESFKYGTGSGGVDLWINTTGDGNTIFGGDILPKAHKSNDLGSNTKAWENAYADDFITLGSAAFANINVTKQLISFPPKEKKTGAFDEYTEKGLKELDPASLPDVLTEGNALLIDEMTTYNYKANYEQQQQIETLKKENAELKTRLERLEKLLLNK